MLTIKKQRHFLIVSSEKSRFANHLTCFVRLDQNLPVFFDPDLEYRGRNHVLIIEDDLKARQRGRR